MNENFFSKDDPAINGHHYHITKKQYNEEANKIYNIDKNRTFNIKSNILLIEQYFTKKQIVNHIIINNITKHTINSLGDILSVKDYS